MNKKLQVNRQYSLQVRNFMFRSTSLGENAELAQWKDVKALLAMQDRHVVKIESQGHGLIETVQESLFRDYDVQLLTKDIISKAAHELVNDLQYTKWYNTPLEQEAVNAQMFNNMKQKHGKLLTEAYLPPISNGLDVHIRVF